MGRSGQTVSRRLYLISLCQGSRLSTSVPGTGNGRSPCHGALRMVQKVGEQAVEETWCRVREPQGKAQRVSFRAGLRTLSPAVGKDRPDGAVHALVDAPLRGLYLTGADICSLGIGGALPGGMLTAAAVLGRNLLGAIEKGAAAARACREGEAA